jgi:hypothetical protein
MGLGPCSVVSLREAQDTVVECRRLLVGGGDSVEQRRQVRMRARIEVPGLARICVPSKDGSDAYAVFSLIVIVFGS